MTCTNRGTDLRVVYLVLSHTETDLVARLARSLVETSPAGAVAIRHDGTTEPLRAGLLPNSDRVRQVGDGSATPWGSWRLTAATLEAMEESLDTFPSAEWVVLLSGQSYPVRPLGELEERLAEMREDAIIKALPDPAETAALRWWRNRPYAADRARFWYLPIPEVPVMRQPLVRRALLSATGVQPFGGFEFLPRDLGTRLVVRSPLSPFRRGVIPQRGSQWVVLRRQVVRWLADFYRCQPRWVRHFRRTLTSDESFIPSVLCNMSAFHVRDGSLHFERKLARAAHAAQLGLSDLPQILASGSFFTRKVSLSNSPELLRELDRNSRVARHSPSG